MNVFHCWTQSFVGANLNLKKNRKHVVHKSDLHLPSRALAPVCHSSCLNIFTEPEPQDKQIDFVLPLERKQLSSENTYI